MSDTVSSPAPGDATSADATDAPVTDAPAADATPDAAAAAATENAAPAAPDAANDTPAPAAPADAPAPADTAPDPDLAHHLRADAFARARCALWQQQAEALHARHPDFDYAAMARDRVFTTLLAAGLPMERAWRAADAERLARAAAAEARRAMAAEVRARGSRVTESGCAPAPAFGVRPDVGRMSDEQVRSVLARIDNREHITFG